MKWWSKLMVCVSALALVTLIVGPHASWAKTKRRVYLEFEAAVVEGRVQRPEAVYIIQRAGLDFTTQIRKESFLKEITESVRKKPF
ncbi:MAG TPA: hypothetical protein ENF73_04895 [Proteobacteria bacterium]|nr:hypothetical protein [Pseudomonadota bacterium]